MHNTSNVLYTVIPDFFQLYFSSVTIHGHKRAFCCVCSGLNEYSIYSNVNVRIIIMLVKCIAHNYVVKLVSIIPLHISRNRYT